MRVVLFVSLSVLLLGGLAAFDHPRNPEAILNDLDSLQRRGELIATRLAADEIKLTEEDSNIYQALLTTSNREYAAGYWEAVTCKVLNQGSYCDEAEISLKNSTEKLDKIEKLRGTQTI